LWKNCVVSTKNVDLVYLVLGKCYENPYKGKFIPNEACYLLAVDMHKKIVTSVPLADSIPDKFVSCVLSRRLRKALLGPCDDQGIPILTKECTKKEPMRDGGNVTED
jgi:hypothetical protein